MARNRYLHNHERHIGAVLGYVVAALFGYWAAGATVSQLHPNLALTAIAAVLLFIGALFTIIVFRTFIPSVRPDWKSDHHERAVLAVIGSVVMLGFAYFAVHSTFQQGGRNWLVGEMTKLHEKWPRFPSGDQITAASALQSAMLAGVAVLTLTFAIMFHTPPSFWVRLRHPFQLVKSKLRGFHVRIPTVRRKPKQKMPKRQKQAPSRPTLTRQADEHAELHRFVATRVRSDQVDATVQNILSQVPPGTPDELIIETLEAQDREPSTV